MNFKFNPVSTAVKLALGAGALAAFGIGTATAQEAATQLDRIEVTGSRIRSVDAETSQPVLTIDRAQIQAQGLTSVADVLQRISANGAGINTTFNNGGDGSSNVDLRGLGAARTLVLVNGRRWVAGLGGTVDLNTIPSAIIERVEVLKDGASSIYGSDAIAGVVNIITRNNYEGAEANVYFGQWDAGDGDRTAVDATVGLTSDRGSLVVSVAHVTEDEVMAGDREISATPAFGLGAARFSGLGKNGRIWNGGATGGFTPITVREGSTPTGPAGQQRYALDQFVPWTAVPDAYNFAVDNYLLTPQRRTSMYTQGRYDLTDNVAFVFDTLYNERRSAQQLAGFPLNGGLSNPHVMSGESYFNPYNVNYGGDGRDIFWSRRLVEQERLYQQSVKTIHIYAGLEGFFNVGERYFDWDVGYAFNKSNQNDTEVGDANLLNVGAGVGPSFFDPTTNTVVCGTPDAPIAGCVPFNPLVPAGLIPQDQLDFIFFTAQDSFQFRNETVTANLTGDLFQLPAGMMGFAVGYEGRRESGFDQPDAFVAAGATSGNARERTEGAYSLDEYYAELLVPVLSGVPFADLLEFTVATRYSDYSNFGDTTNNKFGFKWKPVESLLVRGNWAEGFRAPSILNLFRGPADTFSQFGDPCSVDFPGYNATIAARCAADGVPADYLQVTGNANPGYFGQTRFPFTIGGNEDLGPETSTSKTLGLVWSPTFVENLDFSLDYWSIEIENGISSPSPTYILNQCYQEGNTAFCGTNNFIRRNDGVVTNMFLGPRNLAEINMEGYDFNVRYRTPETSIGAFGFVFDSSYITKKESRATPQDEFDSSLGRAFQFDPNWRLRANLTNDWTLGDFGLTWAARYRSSLVEACPTAARNAGLCSDPDRRIDSGPAPRNKLGSVTYHDLQARYNLPWNATVRVGANNVLDKDPPVSYQAFANSFDPQYDLPGRYYYMSYTQRF